MLVTNEILGNTSSHRDNALETNGSIETHTESDFLDAREPNNETTLSRFDQEKHTEDMLRDHVKSLTNVYWHLLFSEDSLNNNSESKLLSSSSSKAKELDDRFTLDNQTNPPFSIENASRGVDLAITPPTQEGGFENEKTNHRQVLMYYKNREVFIPMDEDDEEPENEGQTRVESNLVENRCVDPLFDGLENHRTFLGSKKQSRSIRIGGII